MNSSTTTATPNGNSTVTYSFDQLYPYFQSLVPPIANQFYLWGYLVTFVLGFVGNAASLFTFAQPTLRSVSTGCLFIVLAISDTFYLLVSIIDFVEFGLQVRLYSRVAYDDLCRFRLFVISMTQLCSAWVLVIISVDRWIRTRFPFKSGSLCTRKKALLAVAVFLVVDVGLNSHVLTPSAGTFLPGVPSAACGPTVHSGQYLIFYFFSWTVVQVFTISVVPVILMLLILIDIFIQVRIRKQALFPQTRSRHVDAAVQRGGRVQKQMFFLMLSSITIFLITTLPWAIYRMLSPRQLTTSSSFGTTLTFLAVLTWLLSVNYGVNFYAHCLSSKLFRKEFLKHMCRRGQSRVGAMELTQTMYHTQN